MNNLSVGEFGAELLRTNDLDPVYVALWEARLDRPTLHRWLLAYWCYYHSGTASWIVDQSNYWAAMEAAIDKAYPRSSERRHFRGKQAAKSVAYLRGRGVESLFAPFGVRDRVLDVRQVMEEVQGWVGFGPWIAFKVADMLERLGLARVRFDDGAMFLFDSPREGAERLWREVSGVGEDAEPPPDVGPWAVAHVLTGLRSSETRPEGPGGGGVGFTAPPRHERAPNAQEAETILCKWNSHRKGHYHVGEDVAALRRGLLRFAFCPTSQRLLGAGRDGGLWG